MSLGPRFIRFHGCGIPVTWRARRKFPTDLATRKHVPRRHIEGTLAILYLFAMYENELRG